MRRTSEDLQQRVLRAVATGAGELHSQATRERFDLGPSSSVTAAIESLTTRAILSRASGGVDFENPFFREWVRRETGP